jgi:hypothetical protein
MLLLFPILFVSKEMLFPKDAVSEENLQVVVIGQNILPAPWFGD